MPRSPKPSELALQPKASRRLAAARVLASFGRQEVVLSTPWLTVDELGLLDQLGDLRVFHSVCRLGGPCAVCEGLA